MKWPWTKTFPKAVVGGEDADERARLNGAVYAKMWSDDWGRIQREVSKLTGLNAREALTFMCLHEFALIRLALFRHGDKIQPILDAQIAEIQADQDDWQGDRK